jgi:NAD(P)-dependent dehydrogenase (short-subunit alcohol dehydrogenase family)
MAEIKEPRVLEPSPEQFFAGQVAIVTGGSMGMGAAMADYFAVRGATVYNLDLVNRTNSGSLAGKVITRIVNVSDTQALKATVATILSETNNRVDHLLAHAGIHRFTSAHSTPEDLYDLVMNVNVRGIFFAIQAVLPAMMEAKQGSIVITGSDQAFIGKAASSVYGMSKAAVAQLTKSVAVEYAAHNIRCNCVCPGTIETPLVAATVQRYVDSNPEVKFDDVMEGLKTAQPIQRMGRPEEIAFVVGSVARSTFMTGALVPVDGGFTAM